MVDAWRRLKNAGYSNSAYKNITSLELCISCKIGRELFPNVKIERIHFGSNDKVVILGSGMTSRIEPAADVLRKEGFSVELFNKESQTKPFIIDGKSYTFNELNLDWDNKWEAFNGKQYVNYTEPRAKEFFESTLMYKANKQFIQKIKKEDYTIIHIGQIVDSYFCDMENELIKSLLWIK